LHARLLALGIIKCQCVPTILATACVGRNITRHLGQTECVVEFAISQQPSIGGHQGAAKLEHQANPSQVGKGFFFKAYLSFLRIMGARMIVL
jgi:hypothetical protein